MNQVALAHSSTTFFAYSFVFDSSNISLNASKISNVLLRTCAAVSANSLSFRHSISGWILYPPSMVPRIFTASILVIYGLEVLPVVISAKNAALTYAA